MVQGEPEMDKVPSGDAGAFSMPGGRLEARDALEVGMDMRCMKQLSETPATKAESDLRGARRKLCVRQDHKVTDLLGFLKHLLA
jgi:hypothetical protein